MTAQEQFDALARGPMADALHLLGLRGTYRRFFITSGRFKGIVELQKSRHSTSEEVTYWVNLTAISSQARQEMWRGNLAALRPRFWTTGRMHYLVGSNQALREAGMEVIGDLQSYGVPALRVGLNEPDFNTGHEDSPDSVEALGLGGGGLMTLFGGIWAEHGTNGWRDRGIDWDITSTEGLIELTGHPNSSVREWATSWLVRRHVDNPAVTPRLIEIVTSDNRSNVRRAAVSMLAHRRTDNGVLDLLPTLASGDPSYSVRWWARFGLALQAAQQ
jgi:HEAT repeats